MIELLVVIAILAILAGMIIPVFNGCRNHAKKVEQNHKFQYEIIIKGDNLYQQVYGDRYEKGEKSVKIFNDEGKLLNEIFVRPSDSVIINNQSK